MEVNPEVISPSTSVLSTQSTLLRDPSGRSDSVVKLFPWQQEVLEAPERFKTVMGGRRIGKTHLLIIFLFLELLRREDWSEAWYMAPYYRQAKMIGWPIAMQFLEKFPWIKAGEPHTNDLTIPVIGNRKLSLKGCEKPNSTRGQGLVAFGFDEYAHNKDSAMWNIAVRPALSDKKGKGIFSSSPRGINQFTLMLDRGDPTKKKVYSENYSSFEIWTKDIGTVSEEELEDLRSTHSPDFYRQEYECKILSNVGLAVGEFVAKSWPDGNLISSELFSKYRSRCAVIGAMDWAESSGTTAYLEIHIDPEGRIFVTHEVLMKGGSPISVVKRLKEEVRHPDYIVMGHDVQKQDDSGWTVADQLRRAGHADGFPMSIFPLYRKKADAIAKAKDMCLSQTDPDGTPRLPFLMIREGSCPVLLEQICTTDHEDLVAKGKSSQGKRDAFDALLTVVMRHAKGRPQPPVGVRYTGRRIQPWSSPDEFASVSGLPQEE